MRRSAWAAFALSRARCTAAFASAAAACAASACTCRALASSLRALSVSSFARTRSLAVRRASCVARALTARQNARASTCTFIIMRMMRAAQLTGASHCDGLRPPCECTPRATAPSVRAEWHGAEGPVSAGVRPPPLPPSPRPLHDVCPAPLHVARCQLTAHASTLARRHYHAASHQNARQNARRRLPHQARTPAGDDGAPRAVRRLRLERSQLFDAQARQHARGPRARCRPPHPAPFVPSAPQTLWPFLQLPRPCW